MQTYMNEIKFKDVEDIKLIQERVDKPSDLLRDAVFID
jgi:hypothetical protein